MAATSSEENAKLDNGEKGDAEAKKADAAANDEGEGQVQLKPTITLLNGITIIVGSIIGSGIFITPSGVQKYASSVGASLMVWVFGGVFSMIGAYCYAELGCMIRKSGADYAYLMEAFGRFIAFLRIWIECIIVRPVTLTIMSLTFATYLISPFYEECEKPQAALRCLAIASIVLLTFINCYSVKLAVRVQDVFTYAKVLALLLIILTGIVQLCRGYTYSFENMFATSSTNPSDYAFAVYSSLFAYFGWNYLNYVIEEMKDPRKDLPIAIAVSIIICMLIYVMSNVAYYTMLTPDEVLTTPAVAILFAKRIYSFMWWIMPIFVALSCFGGMNGTLFTTARLFYVGAREGQMPQVLAMVQMRQNTPAPACLFIGLLSLIYFVSTDITTLINYLSFVNWLAIGMSAVALLVFRRTHPEWERPIKVSLFFPIVYILFSAFLIAMPLITNFRETMIGVLMILSGIPVYWIFISWEKKPKSIVAKINGFTLAVQKLLMVVPTGKTR